MQQLLHGSHSGPGWASPQQVQYWGAGLRDPSADSPICPHRVCPPHTAPRPVTLPDRVMPSS